MQKQSFLETLLSAIGFTFALFLFLPLVVYLLNLDSVSVPKVVILLAGIVIVFASSLILIAMSWLPVIGRWICRACQVGLIAVIVFTVFPNQTGELSGLGTVATTANKLFTTAKLLAVLSAGVWLAWRKPQFLSQLSRYGFIVVLLVTGYVAVGPSSVSDKKTRKEATPPASFSQLGSANNVVVIIFDCFTGYRMAEVLKEHPDLREKLPGFVFYPSALASAMNTPAGLGAILTGDLKTSLASGSIEQRTAESMKNSFLADAKRQGLTTGYLNIFGANGVDIPSTPSQQYFKLQPLSLLNCLPHYLGFFALSLTRIAPDLVCSTVKTASESFTKRIRQGARTDWDLLYSVQDYLDRRSLASKMAFEYFVNSLSVSKNKGSVLVIHSVLTHPPNNFTASGIFTPDTGQGYEGTSVYAANELARLCAKLHTLGVYDSSLIIAVADHGAIGIKDKTMGGRFLPPQNFPVDNNPLLMVKAPGASGPCRDSAMSAWLGDVSTTVRDFLHLPVSDQSMFASRSLLQAEMPQRTLNVPIFHRPDKASYHSSLSEWVRQDFTGTFQDYGSLFVGKLEDLLQQKAHVTLFAGIDRGFMQTLKKGQVHDKKTPYSGLIEVNGRQLAKINKPGIAVITGNDNYQTQIFEDLAAAEAFLQKIPPERDRLVIGLQVPLALTGRLFPEALSMLTPKAPVGFVAVSGPSYGPTPKVVVGNGDVSLDIDWKR